MQRYKWVVVIKKLLSSNTDHLIVTPVVPRKKERKLVQEEKEGKREEGKEKGGEGKGREAKGREGKGRAYKSSTRTVRIACSLTRNGKTKVCKVK